MNCITCFQVFVAGRVPLSEQGNFEGGKCGENVLVEVYNEALMGGKWKKFGNLKWQRMRRV
jgi:hypothetical protein